MAMPDPTDVIGYAKAADAYWQAGWRGVLPLPHKFKKSPPSVRCAHHPRSAFRSTPSDCPDCVSYTGHRGIDPSYADIMAWSEQYPNGNLCLRLPIDTGLGYGVIGIDVDAYGAKTGAAAFAEAKRLWGPLPPAPRSTSREDDTVSGIRLFRVPPGTVLRTAIAFPELGIGDIEVIQYHHRYVNSWPSIHPEDREYWWRNDDNQLIGIPEPGELPNLPTAWLNGLKIVPRELALPDAHYDVQQAMTAGAPSPTVGARLREAIKELNLPGQGRHDAACRHVMALLRLGKNGQSGVRNALGVLCEVLVAARRVDDSDTPEGTRLEFDRMITNDNVARELAQPDSLEWMRELIVDETPGSNGASPHISETPTAGNGHNAAPSPSPAPRSHLEEIEQGFWESRESLNTIYVASLARLCSPWAVLAFCAARTLAQVRPNWKLPALIGGSGGSLNWFGAIADRSSGGKTTAMSLARHLISGDVRERNLGSGEGIIGAYYKPAVRKDETDEFHESNMFIADEVDTVAALGARTGQTTMGVLRSAFSGETLGFSYIAKGRDIHLDAHTYRMTLVVSVQPGRSSALLDDQAGGTPQRFMWFPANDQRISRKHQSIWIPGPLELPDRDFYPREIPIPDEAADMIIDERVRNGNGEVGEMDGHSLFCREKFAFALTLLDGRVDMTSQDWELSGIAAEVSAHTRQWVAAGLASARERDAEARGSLRGIEQFSAEIEKNEQTTKQADRVLRWLLHKLDDSGDDGITQADLGHAIAGRDRRMLQQILASGSGLIRSVIVDGSVRWYRA